MNGDGIMRLQKLYLKNFRGIPEMDLNLDGKSSVFFGINGVGKSSIIMAINALFATIINKIASNQFKQYQPLTVNDIMVGTPEALLYGLFQFDDGIDMRYGFRYVRNKNTATKRGKRADLDVFHEHFDSSYLADDASGNPMPIFVSYGVNRAAVDIPVRIKTKHEFGRLSAYENAVAGTKTDFRTFFEWFRNQEDIENAEKVERADLSYRDTALEAVRKAITGMLPELSDIKIKRSPLRMSATKNGKNLRMEQFSDGEKCVLAMLGDLARRLAIANPEAADPLTCGGIVLIDEIELHMHPAWQRKIMPTLQNIFPNIQFIVTTHSPQVLGELNADFNLFRIEQLITEERANIVATSMEPGLYDSNLVLADLMGTTHVSEEVSRLEALLTTALQERATKEAQFIISKLSELTNGTDPMITQAKIMLRRMGC